MSDSPISKGEVLSLIVRLAALTTVSYYTMKLLMDAIDPTRKQKLAAQKRAEKLLKRYIQIYRLFITFHVCYPSASVLSLMCS